MKVCILSDSHDHWDLLDAATADAVGRGAAAILHCGDVVAPATLRVLDKYRLPVHVIHGNNAGDLYTLARLAHAPGSVIRYHGQDADLVLDSRRIFLVHYPHYARAMAVTGDYDVVCCGHDHRAAVQSIANIKGGHTPLVNPGTVGGVGTRATYVLGDLTELEFSVQEVCLGSAGEDGQMANLG